MYKTANYKNYVSKFLKILFDVRRQKHTVVYRPVMLCGEAGEDPRTPGAATNPNPTPHMAQTSYSLIFDTGFA